MYSYLFVFFGRSNPKMDLNIGDIHWVRAASLLVAVLLILNWLRSVIFDPLRGIPGPFIARFTRLWLLRQYIKGNYHKTNIELHKEYGAYQITSKDFSTLFWLTDNRANCSNCTGAIQHWQRWRSPNDLWPWYSIHEGSILLIGLFTLMLSIVSHLLTSQLKRLIGTNHGVLRTRRICSTNRMLSSMLRIVEKWPMLTQWLLWYPTSHMSRLVQTFYLNACQSLPKQGCRLTWVIGFSVTPLTRLAWSR